jgi:hypothetical protein
MHGLARMAKAPEPDGRALAMSEVNDQPGSLMGLGGLKRQIANALELKEPP